MVSGFCCEFFQIPSSSFCKKQKEVKSEEKNTDGPQKAKVNVNIDCYSLIKRSAKSQGKVREFLTFWCMSGNPVIIFIIIIIIIISWVTNCSSVNL